MYEEQCQVTVYNNSCGANMSLNGQITTPGVHWGAEILFCMGELYGRVAHDGVVLEFFNLYIMVLISPFALENSNSGYFWQTFGHIKQLFA